jgi:thiamine pyrophosphate-dependent acetolactate synthase large subunit-like protein
MEVEVACRHNLPITFIVFNNNGIGGGPDDIERARMSPGAYIPDARYDRVIEAFGGLGIHVEDPKDLQPAIQKSFERGGPSVINVKISNQSRRRPQQFAWLTR